MSLPPTIPNSEEGNKLLLIIIIAVAIIGTVLGFIF